MGGKGDEGGGQQQDDASLMRNQQQQQMVAAQQAQKTAAAAPVEAPKTEETKTDTTKTATPTTDQTTTGNLTGLGDALVSGLSEGRVQQVADQTDRVAANPQTYAPQFDPYTGTFTGQGPYTAPATKTGQV
jgi:hypothetical protein